MEPNYKIKSDIKEFIITTANKHPELGCRKIALLIQEHQKISVSKSSVSTVLKAKSLNKPMGRRRTNKEADQLQNYTEHSPLAVQQAPLLLSQPVLALTGFEQKTKDSFPSIGCWFLKAADLCLGGSQAISTVLQSVIKDIDIADVVIKNEVLLYNPLLDEQISDIGKGALESIIGKEYPQNIEGYSKSLEEIESLGSEILKRLNANQTDILYLKCIMEDNSCYFIDAACHTIWQNHRIPKELSLPLHKIKHEMNRFITTDIQPLILQSPPGFRAPNIAFLDFITGFQDKNIHNTLKTIELYTTDGRLIETISSITQKKRLYILGLWPWQYADNRQLLPDKKKIVLTEFTTGRKATLRYIPYKKEGRDIIAIITNIGENLLADDTATALYLERWPNLETGYQDFLNTIETSLHCPKGEIEPTRNNSLEEEKNASVSGIFAYWRRTLNSYCQRHFFPSSYREFDFPALKERLYNLCGSITRESRCVKVIFDLPEGFLYADDLLYSCQKVNEADIFLADGCRLQFAIKNRDTSHFS